MELQVSDSEAALLQVLGDVDPLIVLMDTLNAFHDLIEDTEPGHLKTGADGEWSVRDIVAHLVDVELAWGVRIRMILAQDRPAIVEFDEAAWYERFGSLEPDPARIFEQFRILREANLQVLSSASSEDLQRVGVLGDKGDLSAGRVVRMLAGHSSMHLNQAQEILDQAGSGPV